MRYLDGLELLDAPPNIANIVVPACLNLKQSIDTQLLEAAVLKFAKAQTNISHGIVHENETIRFSPIDTEFSDYFEIVPSEKHWISICKEYSNKYINNDFINKPQFKILFSSETYVETNTEGYIGRAYLIACYGHHLGDGTNGLTIVNDILCLYEELKKNSHAQPEKYSTTYTVNQMVDSFFTKRFDKDHAQQKMIESKEKFIQHYLQMYRKVNFFQQFNHIADNKSPVGAQFYVSSSQVYEKFLSKCNERNVTVGTVFIAIKYFAYASFAFQEKNDNLSEIFCNCNIPINLRSRVPLEVAKNCVNVCICQNFITPGIRKAACFWDFANQIKQIMADNFENFFHLFDYGVIKELTQNPYVKENIKLHGVDHHFTVSNMLKYPHDCEYEDFTLTSIHCVGGLWLREWSHLELMIYSTDKFNLSLIHRENFKYTRMARYVFSLVQYLVENIDTIDVTFSLESLINKFPFSDVL